LKTGGYMEYVFNDASSCWRLILSDVSRHKNLLSHIEKFARENTKPAKVLFGTSGWRGEIGSDFTFNNVRIVTSSIIELFKSNDYSFLAALGASNFEEIKDRGVIVGHDNRFLGYDFSMEIIGMLQSEGIKTWYAGEVPTPLFSAGIEMLNAVCSINLTPSHNPPNYAGFKFNPSDGGPAGPDITKRIEELTNEKMQKAPVLSPSRPKYLDKIDLTEIYIDYINRWKTLDLEKIRYFIRDNDVILCVDNMHGSTRGKLERIIGSSNKIVYLRTEDDYLFGGVSPEPSEKNLEGVNKVLRSINAKYKIGAMMDPDGDRIRHTDGEVQIPMNYFGAMAFHYLYKYKGIRGVVVKSVGTSNLVNAIAEKLNVKVIETKVGFKNFRPYMLRTAKERAIVAFEESDGISAFNHTLEKDALFGFLLAIEMVADTRKNMGEYLKEIMDEYGYYCPDRSGISIESKFEGDFVRKRVMSIGDRFKKGTEIVIDEKIKVVKDIISIDGLKVVFNDNSWIMIRPSGTEPKIRFYVEARSEGEKESLINFAEYITRSAIN
jgi:phosphomannomutase